MFTACVLAFTMTFCVPATALATINFGTVTVSVPGSVSVVAGQSASVSCGVSPASHSQAPNCFTSYCPSGCGFGAAEGTDCRDANGQCTCFGGGYTTYYPSVSVSSSNPAVARASYSGGVLTVTGYSAGTTTLSVSADLRLWSSGYGSISVTVSDPAPAVPDPPSGDGSDSGSGGSGGGASAGSDSGGGARAGTVTVKPAGSGSSSALGAVLSASVTAEGTTVGDEAAAEGEEVSVELARIGEAGVAEVLALVAGTKNQACFWAGETAEEADYLWFFPGSALTAEGVTAASGLDLTVADATDDARFEALGSLPYLALDFASRDALPCAATFGWKASRVFANGERLALYSYDERADELVLVEKGIEVVDGYASFTIDHGSLYVLSSDDGLAGPLAADGEAGEDASLAQKNAAGTVEDAAGVPVAAIAGVAVVAVVAATAAFTVVWSRKKRGAAKADADDAAGEASSDGKEGREGNGTA